MTEATAEPTSDLGPCHTYRCSGCGLEVEGGNLNGYRCFLCNRWYDVWLWAGRFYRTELYAQAGVQAYE